MAGDVSYLQVCDENKNILKQIYVGKLRYNNIFSLGNWKYMGSSKLYEFEKRKSDGRTSYNVWSDEIIDEIKYVINNYNPITKLEQEAYDDSKNVIEWIDEIKIKYKEQNIHFVFITDVDC